MFDEYCNICQEHGVLVPATFEFCVQREGDENAHYVRCCDPHKAHGEAVAVLMQRNLDPAALYGRARPVGAL